MLHLKNHSSNEQGFALLEVMIAAALAVVVSLGIAEIVVNMANSQTRTTNVSGVTINDQLKISQILANPNIVAGSLTKQ